MRYSKMASNRIINVQVYSVLAFAVLYLAGASAERRLLQGEPESIFTGLWCSLGAVWISFVRTSRCEQAGEASPLPSQVMPETLHPGAGKLSGAKKLTARTYA